MHTVYSSSCGPFSSWLNVTSNPLLVKLFVSLSKLFSSVSGLALLRCSLEAHPLAPYQRFLIHEEPGHVWGFILPRRVTSGQQIGRHAQMMPVQMCTVVQIWVFEKDGWRLPGM